MTPDVVVDVGNTRVKWGRCSAVAVTEVASLPPGDAAAWEVQTRVWGLVSPTSWVVTGVHPERRERLADWLRQRGNDVRIVTSARQLPLKILLEQPEKVGIDRLLDAVAVNSRRRPEVPAAIVDAGSAVTVDLVDPAGAFLGGAILPGLRLMAHALHGYTALLPVIDLPQAIPPLPGTSTPSAMAAGIFWAVAGGVNALVEQYSTALAAPEIYLTGGDAPLLLPALRGKVVVWPEMTLEGIRLTAESLP
jgi:type III pantothenate kinase